MRSIIALGILLLGLSTAAPEPEYSLLFADYFQPTDGTDIPSLVEIESSTSRSDRLTVTAFAPQAAASGAESSSNQLVLASASDDVDAIANANVDTRGMEVSLGDLCNALYTSAQNNDLPVTFFANLIWQESGLRDDIVSSKGAMGIAQFMPEVAAEKGLDDPFDPLQAIPASARLLRELRLQFGNLGFVAAAYNAGPRRVIEWLEGRTTLPRETRDYVVRVTGLSLDAWRTTPIDSGSLTFVRPLPCRSLPAFASVEQEQIAQAVVAKAKAEQAKPEHDKSAQDKSAQDKSTQEKSAQEKLADATPAPAAAKPPAGETRRERDAARGRQETRRGKREEKEARHDGHARHEAKREASGGGHGKHKNA
jgi:hypothetical protein